MMLPEPALLVISDRGQAVRPLEAIAEAVFTGGCRWFSLREKDLPSAERRALLGRLVALGHRFGARRYRRRRPDRGGRGASAERRQPRGGALATAGWVDRRLGAFRRGGRGAAAGGGRLRDDQPDLCHGEQAGLRTGPRAPWARRSRFTSLRSGYRARWGDGRQRTIMPGSRSPRCRDDGRDHARRRPAERCGSGLARNFLTQSQRKILG